MPELPEVEVVRRGVARGTAGRRVADVEVLHPRAVRRHEAGPSDFAAGLRGGVLQPAQRRGKYLWVPLAEGERALVGHLGMSGQLLVVPPDAPRHPHLRVRLRFDDDGRDLRFVDQRTFGGLLLDDLVPAEGSGATGETVPSSVRHIARDPLDPRFDDAALAPALRRRRTALKRALLDQTLLSGVGNIYADEALWRAGLHGARPTATVTRPEVARLLVALRDVMTAALEAGGTSFDALYVSADGVSGLFDRELAVYGREGLPCPRCGTAVRRDTFMNRSSATCPRCQPRPRRPHP